MDFAGYRGIVNIQVSVFLFKDLKMTIYELFWRFDHEDSRWDKKRKRCFQGQQFTLKFN